ncbi:glycoside hydrolase [Aureobasidium pullulans]|nr:glycoside hydrolase [Aureobasidium pullulans]
MSDTPSLSWKTATRSMVYLLSGLTTFAAFAWHSQSFSQTSSILPRTVDSGLKLLDYSDLFSGASNNTLHSRDTYECSAEAPCSNGACCGGSGYCGYGPTYCGTDCVSNCDAVAECGQYAEVTGTTCPLNTCCSQFGFCGTTSDFCGTGCQSNCELHPDPPGGNISGSVLDSKVIGYYESWSARRDCHKIAPTDLPLDALSHVNFAFAYIDPENSQIMTMDTSTPSSLFQDTANLKSIKPSLKVFVSVGGWSFSDDGTETQAIFGDIAADATKRQTFANNAVKFMKQYGFDGLDLDWEYPGAPDRGGSSEDTKNYVALLKTLRETFNGSGNSFGLTFTAPSSYWYLRWFDLPNMIEYADWINLMTYDLHGAWDSSNPIGSIVQGHTNLTEIKSAAELFWRVKIPASKIVMGFGFYGRSFTLADPSCTTPGCAFSGASMPGPCSDAAGILAHYEIEAVLDADSSIKPTYDKDAAVNYFTFDKDQWVSYDDKTTFKQKIDWANNVGLGGALIWASDLDDDKYSAHAGLLGREVQSTAQLQLVDKALSSPQSVIQNLAGSNGQQCFKHSGKCVNLNDNNAMAAACGSGYTVVGWDDAGCGTKKCNCQWRGDNNGQGSSSDCSAQCLPGETNVAGIKSSWGGGFENDGNTNKCGRGYKAFCCPNPDASQVTSGCTYAKCGASCAKGYTSIFSKVDNCLVSSQQYCCPDPVELTSCHWTGGKGGEECSNAICNSTELEVDRATFGGSNFGGCSWGRQKAACCTVQQATSKPASCSADLCKTLPGFCPSDTDDESANSWIGKRDLDRIHLNMTEDEYDDYVDEYDDYVELTKRAPVEYKAVLYNGAVVIVTAAAYPPIGKLFTVANNNQVIRQAFRLIPGYCIGPSIQTVAITVGTAGILTGLQSEHPIDRQIMAHFIEAAASGLLRGRTQNILPAIGAAFFQNYWTFVTPLLSNLPPIGSARGISPNTINNRIMECFGSTRNPEPFLPTDAAVNGAKGRLMSLADPTDIDKITALAKAAVLSDSAVDADALLQAVRVGFAVFDYINAPDATERWNLVRQQVFTQFGMIEGVFGVPNLQAWWLLFSADWFIGVQEKAQVWADQAITAAASPYIEAHGNGVHLSTYQGVITTVQYWLDNYVDTMTLPDSGSSLGVMALPSSPYYVSLFLLNHLIQMSSIITVVFPKDANGAKYGVTGWNVKKFASGPDSSAPLYAFGSDVFWKSAERLEEAFNGPEAGAIMADVPKFSNKPPVFLYGHVVGSG